MPCRDDSQRRNASWLARKSCQGWFPVEKCILISRKCLGGMISSGEMHPGYQEMSCRDDSQRWKSSWLAGNSYQGCISTEGCVPWISNFIRHRKFIRRRAIPELPDQGRPLSVVKPAPTCAAKSPKPAPTCAVKSPKPAPAYTVKSPNQNLHFL